MGQCAGAAATGSAQQNVIIGDFAADVAQNLGNTVAIGANALSNTTSNAAQNVVIGSGAAFTMGAAKDNVMIGYFAGLSKPTTGNKNIMIGSQTCQSTNSSNTVVIGFHADATTSNQGVLGSDHVCGGIPDWYLGHGVVKACAAAVTLNATGGSGTDNPGGNFVLAGGKGTGTGAGGEVQFSTAAAGACTGTSLNALVQRAAFLTCGDFLLKDQNAIRLEESGVGCSYVAIQPPACLAASYTLTLPADDGCCGQILTTNGTGTLTWTCSGGGISAVVCDLTPQLGGQLDVNGQAIGDGTRELITFTEDASAVNQVNIENQATGGGPIISAAGDDCNIDLILDAKGTGDIVLHQPTTMDGHAQACEPALSTANEIKRYYNSTHQIEMVSTNQGPYMPVPTFRHQTGKWTATSDPCSAKVVNTEGLYYSNEIFFDAAAFVNTSAGVAQRLTSGTGTGDTAGIEDDIAGLTTQTKPWAIWKFALNNSCSGFMGFFVGWINQEIDVNINASLNCLDGIGLQFYDAPCACPVGADTNFMFVSQDTVTSTRVNTCVAVDNNVHYLIINANSATCIKLELWNACLTTKQACTTFTTNLPAGTDIMKPVIGVQSQAGGNAQIMDFYYMNTVLRA
jgi:hypothetical protein